MPPEIFTGPDMSALLERARATLGPDAAVVAVRRTASGYELEASFPGEAAPRASRARRDGPRVIALVGPTGAGKTTTLAKLANHPGAFGGHRVGLLCLDTYRVGAVEQIGIYAELSRVPLEVAYESVDVERARRRLHDCEVILVDTAGRGPRAARDREATREHLQRLVPDEVHLCLPSGLNLSMARRIAADHRDYGVTHVLPTKRDECPEDESALAVGRELQLPTTWWTDGQEVPADLRFTAGSARPRGLRDAAFAGAGA